MVTFETTFVHTKKNAFTTKYKARTFINQLAKLLYEVL